MKADCVEILGVRVDPVRWVELRERVVKAAQSPGSLTVMYANIHVINTANGAPALRDALRSADIVYCDGEGVRIAARIQARRLPERMTGADFVFDLARRLAEVRGRVFWLGGAPGTAATAMLRLTQRYPGFTVVGTHHGFFAKHGVENSHVIDAINSARPDILFVGMGTPVQEEWVARHRSELRVPAVWCIGATADFVAGAQPRGPALLTQNGFEWLARLWSDPRRLFRRYVIGNPLFMARVVRARLTERAD